MWILVVATWLGSLFKRQLPMSRKGQAIVTLPEEDIEVRQDSHLVDRIAVDHIAVGHIVVGHRRSIESLTYSRSVKLKV